MTFDPNLPPLVVISLGWGVQSFTLAAMSAIGDLPKVDAALHSDTFHERESTYQFIREWTPWLEQHGVHVHRVANHDKEGTDAIVGENMVQIPAFTLANNKKGQIRRQCTDAWKVGPIRRWLQARRGKRRVEMWLGISLDEFQRAKDSQRKYIQHRFPLLELNMSRQDCLDYLAAHDLPSPGKSSCVFCPYLNKASWQDMRANHPQDWEKAVKIDREIRDVRLPGQLFIHSSRQPIELAVDIIEFENAQESELLKSDDADAECDSGHCFL